MPLAFRASREPPERHIDLSDGWPESVPKCLWCDHSSEGAVQHWPAGCLQRTRAHRRADIRSSVTEVLPKPSAGVEVLRIRTQVRLIDAWYTEHVERAPAHRGVAVVADVDALVVRRQNREDVPLRFENDRRMPVLTRALQVLREAALTREEHIACLKIGDPELWKLRRTLGPLISLFAALKRDLAGQLDVSSREVRQPCFQGNRLTSRAVNQERYRQCLRPSK